MRLATSVVGGAVGFAIGGPFGARIGFTVGSIVGGILFSPEAETDSGTPLHEMNLAVDAPGTPTPEALGRGRIRGSVIWMSEVRRQEHTQSAGGGCGFGQEQTATTYTYHIDVAYAFGEAPFDGAGAVDIVRLWFNKRLQFNATRTDVETTLANKSIADTTRFYLGSETQLADPLIEAAETNAPAYRGTVYAVFENLNLSKFGNSLPLIEAEVRTTGSVSLTFTETNQFTASLSSDGGFTRPFWHRGWLDDDGSLRYYSGKVLSYDSELQRSTLEYRSYSVFGGVATGPFLRFKSIIGLQVTTAGLRAGGRLTTTESDFCYGDRPFDLFESSGLIQFIDINGQRDRLIVPDDTGGIDSLAGAAVYGTHLYLHGRAGSDSTWWIWYVDLSLPDPGAIKLVQDPFTSSTRDFVGVNCDASGWWVWKNLSPFQLVTYPHGSSVASATISLTRMYHGVWRDQAGSSDFVGHNDTTWYQIDAAAETSLGTHDSGAVGVDPWRQAAYGLGLAITQSDSDFAPIVRVHTVSRSYAGGNPTVGDLVGDLCQRAGLAPADIDTTELTDTLIGVTRTGPMPIRNMLEPMAAVFGFDKAESDYQIKFRLRDRASSLSIVSDDLAAHIDGAEKPPDVVLSRIEELELPHKVIVQHAAGVSPGQYNPTSTEAARIHTTSVAQIVQRFPGSFGSPVLARQAAEKMLYEAWSGREQVSFSVGPKHYALDPGDVVDLVAEDGETRTVRITSTDLQFAGAMKCEGIVYSRAPYTVSDDATAQADPQTDDTVPVAGPTVSYNLDIPLLSEAHDNYGWYWLAHGLASGWTGAALFWSRDDATYTLVQDVVVVPSETIVAGSATTALAAPADVHLPDYANSVTVYLNSASMTLSSTTRALMLETGANAALLGDEVIHFQDVVDNGDGTWTLSTFLRGKRGTDWAIGAHVLGERFVLLDANIEDVEQDSTLDDVAIWTKSVSVGNPASSALGEPFTNTNVRLRPFSPVRIRGSRDGSNNLTITWLARSRLFATEFREPARGDARAYEVDVMSGSTVLRTIAGLVTESASYTASEQTTDGFTPGDPVEVNVYQISSNVGRGYAGNDTV